MAPLLPNASTHELTFSRIWSVLFTLEVGQSRGKSGRAASPVVPSGAPDLNNLVLLWPLANR